LQEASPIGDASNTHNANVCETPPIGGVVKSFDNYNNVKRHRSVMHALLLLHMCVYVCSALQKKPLTAEEKAISAEQAKKREDAQRAKLAVPLAKMNIKLDERCVDVDNPDKLAEVRELVFKQKEVYVDMEFSNDPPPGNKEAIAYVTVSFGGKTFIFNFVRLLQRLQPFIRDMLGDGNIAKVFHGCSNDARYSRLCGMRIVNVIDTQVAWNVIVAPRHYVQKLRAGIIAPIGLTTALSEFEMVAESQAIESAEQTADFAIDPFPNAQRMYLVTGTKWLGALLQRAREHENWDEALVRRISQEIADKGAEGYDSNKSFECPVRKLHEEAVPLYDILSKWRVDVYTDVVKNDETGKYSKDDKRYLGTVMKHYDMYALAVYTGVDKGSLKAILGENAKITDTMKEYEGELMTAWRNAKDKIYREIPLKFSDMTGQQRRSSKK
jgi:hypothetical protein